MQWQRHESTLQPRQIYGPNYSPVNACARLPRVSPPALMQLRMPVRQTDLPAVWRAMEGVKAEGRSIGMSNFLVRQLNEIAVGVRVVPAVNQIEYHPYVHKATRAQLDYHAKHGIAATSARPGAGEDCDAGTGERRGRAWTCLRGRCCSCGCERRALRIPCITMGKVERLKEYLAVGGLPDLTDEKVQEIDDAVSTVHKRRPALPPPRCLTLLQMYGMGTHIAPAVVVYTVSV